MIMIGLCAHKGGVRDTGPDPVDTGPDSVDARQYPDDASSNEETDEIETVDTVDCNCAISKPRASSSLALLLLSALLLRRRQRI
jgi:MYXO-CTERM domain-containing protein